MYEKVRLMIKGFLSNFGKPSYDLGNDDKIHEADEHIRRLRDLERRLKLLDIQSTPRGQLNG